MNSQTLSRGSARFISAMLLLLSMLLAACGEQNNAATAGNAAATAAGSQSTAAAAPAPAEATAAQAVTDSTATAALTAIASTDVTAATTAEPASTTSAQTPTSAAPATPGPGEFVNPVLRYDYPDPHVINVDGTYYLYATNGSGRNVQTARSQDLISWELLSDAMPSIGKWAKTGFTWAPEVIQIGDKFNIYYTARDRESNKQCVGVAVADAPDGKFKDPNDKALVCQVEEGGTIDANPFRDGDKLYLLYKNDGNCCGFPTHLYIQEMAPDGLSLVGEPARLVRNDRSWEGRVVEAPTMWKHEDRYYLFFSGNDYAGLPYAVGYAICEGPMGPCEDAPENPILKSALKRPPVIGPGHQTIVTDDDGETWLVYHAYEVSSAGLKTNRRFVWIDQLDWEDGKPIVRGPTTEPQPVP